MSFEIIEIEIEDHFGTCVTLEVKHTYCPEEGATFHSIKSASIAVCGDFLEDGEVIFNIPVEKIIDDNISETIEEKIEKAMDYKYNREDYPV